MLKSLKICQASIEVSTSVFSSPFLRCLPLSSYCKYKPPVPSVDRGRWTRILCSYMLTFTGYFSAVDKIVGVVNNSILILL